MEAKFCPQCGTARVGAFAFCRNCGYNFEGGTAAPPAAPTPAVAQPTATVVESPTEAVPTASLFAAAAAPPLTPPAPPPPSTGTGFAAIRPVAPVPPPLTKPKWYRGRLGIGAGVVGVVLILAAISQAGRPSSPAGSGAGASSAATTKPAATTLAVAPTRVPWSPAAPTPDLRTPPPPAPEPTPEPTEPPSPPTTYAKLTARQWAKLVKAPDDYYFDTYQIWACITQFDAATGPSSFRGDASYRREDYWFEGENSFFEGDETDLEDFVTDDVVVMNVTVFGSYTYDTTIGGSLTVPQFYVDKITHKGSC